jgi:hypothetical protein
VRLPDLGPGHAPGRNLFLYTAKTGTPVYVPLPPEVVEALGKLDTNGSGRFFSTGNAKPQTASANWSRYLETLFDLAGMQDGHSTVSVTLSQWSSWWPGFHSRAGAMAVNVPRNQLAHLP